MNRYFIVHDNPELNSPIISSSLFINDCVIFTAFLSFQSVYPSSWSVFKNKVPWSPSEYNVIISAGILSPPTIFTISPTIKSLLFTLIKPSARATSYYLELALVRMKYLNVSFVGIKIIIRLLTHSEC
jgi:hypothetical protein